MRSTTTSGLVLAVAVVLSVVLAGVTSASAAGPVWRIATLADTTVPPGATLTYLVEMKNVGDATTDGSDIVLLVRLPDGLTVQGVATPFNTDPAVFGWSCTAGDGSPLAGASDIRCTVPATSVDAQDHRSLVVNAAVAADASGALTSSFELSGGGASTVDTVDPTRVSGTPPGFGVDAFDGQVSAADGGTSTQAGGHPAALTTWIDFNTVHNSFYDSLRTPFGGVAWPAQPIKDVLVHLPSGFLGDPAIAAKCSAADLTNGAGTQSTPLCPPTSQIGTSVVRMSASDLGVLGPVPVFNMVPPPGVPARFGFQIAGSVVNLDVGVASGSDYAALVKVRNISEGLATAGTSLTLWGAPSDPSHDSERSCPGHVAPSEGGPSCSSGAPHVALLRNPTSCAAPAGSLTQDGLETTIAIDSWAHPGALDPNGEPVAGDPNWQHATWVTHDTPGYPLPFSEYGPHQLPTGCEKVPFTPSALITPTSSVPDSPSGLDVNITVPQEAFSEPDAISQADMKSVRVTLPEGMAINPSAAGGLDACTPAQIALHSTASPTCPDASKIGSVELKTPALEEPLEGSLYLASQTDNPFGSLLAAYLVAEGQGVVLKFPGKLEADPVTGRLSTIFDGLPQDPASSVKIGVFGGSHGSLTTPSTCGDEATSSTLEGWNGKSATQSTPYTVDCTPGLGGFNPALDAGTVNPQAGAFTPFTLTLSRQDGEQDLAGLTVKTPPGFSGILKGIAKCPEPQAAQGTCGEDSLIGHVTAAAGAGPDPFYATGGRAYLTGPYKGSPFGLSITVPAKAGPFDLGTVVVRSRVDVDPRTAQIVITSDPFPQILQGIPLQIRKVNVTVDRANFTFNPTNCNPFTVDGTITSTQSATANVSSRFQAANCATLPFHPSFRVSTKAATSKKGGAFLNVKVGSGSGQANLGKVAVSLPKQLPSRLTTIQQACVAAVFTANPASCPVGSNIGIATATTPILANPVTGPAYLVSHGGAAFPDVVMVLQAEGVTLQVVGSIDIKKGVTSSAFNSIPDAPISTFELSLPQGPHSALGSNLPAKAKGSLCGQRLVMPTTLTGQNGAQVKQSTKIAVAGCPKAKKAKHTRRAHGKKKHPKKGKKGQ